MTRDQTEQQEAGRETHGQSRNQSQWVTRAKHARLVGSVEGAIGSGP